MADKLPGQLITTNKIYDTIIEAEKDTEIHHSNITAVCKGRRQKAGEYHWQYLA
jgi:hypothetical protein